MKLTLLVVQGRPAAKKLVFPAGEFLIGRGLECHVRPDSDWVSRQHCVLRVAGEGAFLRDLGSRNGTLVNGELLTRERELHCKDLIQIGPLVFEVHCESLRLPAQPDDKATVVFARAETVRSQDVSRAAAEEESILPEALPEPAPGEPAPTAPMPQSQEIR